MTRAVVSVAENDTVARVNQIMVEKKFKGVPAITADGQVVGIVTMSDVSRVPKEKMETTRVSEIMTQNVVTIEPKASLYEVLRKMTINNLRQTACCGWNWKTSGDTYAV